MTIAPPRPADTGQPADAGAMAGHEPDTTSLQRQAHGLRKAAALLMVPAAVLLAVAAAEFRLWAPLTRTGTRAPAEVVGASHWKWSDRLRVAFATPDGRLVEASIPVSDVYSHPVTSTVEVAYDPANPRRVRTVEGWNPPYVIPLGLALLLAAMSSAFAWRAWQWPRRLRRLAAETASGRPMVLATVVVPGRVPPPWAVLWDSHAPPDARPSLAFRLADAGDGPDDAVDVELVAERRRKAVGFVRTETGVIWPAGKVRQPPRSVRRAVEKAERELLAREGEAEAPPLPAPAPPAGVAFEDVRGDLPPLPADLFEKTADKDRVSPKVLVAVVPMLFALSGLVMPDLVEAHRQICPAPPPAAGGEAGALPPDALASSLPGSLPGYTPGYEGARTIASFPTPATVTALAGAGYLTGYERNFVQGATAVKVQVYQFGTELGPARYEASRLATLCSFSHRRLTVPAGSGASGVVMKGDRSTHRMSFVRGTRDYVVAIEGVDVHGQADVLARVLETAR